MGHLIRTLQWRKCFPDQVVGNLYFPDNSLNYRPGTIIYVCAFYLTYDSLIPLIGGVKYNSRGVVMILIII